MRHSPTARAHCNASPSFVQTTLSVAGFPTFPNLPQNALHRRRYQALNATAKSRLSASLLVQTTGLTRLTSPPLQADKTRCRNQTTAPAIYEDQQAFTNLHALRDNKTHRPKVQVSCHPSPKRILIVLVFQKLQLEKAQNLACSETRVKLQAVLIYLQASYTKLPTHCSEKRARRRTATMLASQV